MEVDELLKAMEKKKEKIEKKKEEISDELNKRLRNGNNINGKEEKEMLVDLNECYKRNSAVNSAMNIVETVVKEIGEKK